MIVEDKQPCNISGNGLEMDGLSLTTLADRFGTPLYVTSERRLRENYRRLAEAFSSSKDGVRINYAVKANSNPAVISVLRQEGAGADVSSIGELLVARSAGLSPEKILFSANFAPKSELEYAALSGTTLNFDSLDQFLKVADLCTSSTVSFRINPGEGKGEYPGITTAGKDAKFGIPADRAAEAYARAKAAGVKKFGIHMMTGSNVLDETYLPRMTSILLEIASRICKGVALKFDFVDLGGGLGVPYHADQPPLNIAKVGRQVVEVFTSKCEEYELGNPVLTLEPGRYLVADTTVLLGRVNSIKRYEKVFIGTDVGMNQLLRPALYGAYHEVAVANRPGEMRSLRADLVGQICENTDILARDRNLPPVEEGDIVVFYDCGAYGYSMSNNYNGRPRAAEVIVSPQARAHLTRQREDNSELTRGTIVPPHLLR